MTDLFGPDKDVLRQVLPIREVARQLTTEYGCEGPYILTDGTALCPFHDDTSESFYLWDGDDGIERWWCQPCGFGGDIFDLIRRSLGLSFPQSVEAAQKMYAAVPPGYVPPKADEPKRVRASIDQWYNSVEVARAYAAKDDKQGIFAVALNLVPNTLEARADALEWDEHIRSWGWGMTPQDGATGAGVLRGNVIIMPHWDTRSNLTGVKTRSGAQKGSLPGSTYTALYGSWFGRRNRDVLLTEGESDAVYGSFIARKEGVAIDVFGLPAGAQKPPLAEHGDFLAGTRTVYLAFDPDPAGVAATRRWITFLNERGFQDVRVVSLPFGIDLRSARPNLKDLLARAKAPLGTPARIMAAPGGFQWDTGKQDDNGNALWSEVTNWTLDPVARLSGGEAGFDVIVQTRKTSEEAVIRLSELSDTRALTKWANGQGLLFTGSDPQRKLIAEWVEAQGSILPDIYQSEQVGAHAPPDEYDFAGESFLYPSKHIGPLPWRYTPFNRAAADVSDRILLPPKNGAVFQWEWLEAFLKLSEPAVMHPILAWVIASMRRHTVKNFPMLYIGGSSGVGKSTLARCAMRLAGSDIEVNLGAVTPFILTKTLASTTNMPVFVDEWTLLSRRDTLEGFQGAIPLLYAGERAERGQADLSAVVFKQTAPTIIAGEQELSLDREIDRMVAVFPSRAKQDADALARIENVPLEAFAYTFHHFLLRAEKLTALDYAPAPSRPIYNEQVLRAGWAILREFLDRQMQAGEDVPEIPEVPDLSCFALVAEDRKGGNAYEVALEAGIPMRDKNAIPVVWADPEGRGTWVRVRELIGEIKSRRLDIQLPGGERAMLRYFEERYPVEKSALMKPPGGSMQVRANLIHSLHVTEAQEEDIV